MSFGWTKATGGAWYVNPSLEYNWRSIKAAGLQRGAYAYAFESSGCALPGPGPEAEADFFCATLEPLGLETGDLLALDIEEGPSGPLGDWVLRWLQRVEQRLGWKPLVYTGKWFSDPHGFPQCPGLADYGLWLAAYTSVMPPPPAPWPVTAFWQYTADATVPGIDGPCDMSAFNGALDRLPLYGKPAGSAPPEAPPQPEPTPPQPEPVPPSGLPIYDPTYPAISQNDAWSCGPTTTRWMLYSIGRTPSEEWIESTMIAEGVANPDVGCTDKSGAGLADFVTRHYGYATGSNGLDATFDELAALAGTQPYGISGEVWYHWSGLRGFDGEKLLLANPASGWMGITQSLDRDQFARLGPWSYFWIDAQLAGAAAPPDPGPTPNPPNYAGIGSGLIEMMTAAGVTPAQSASSWIGGPPAEVETCYASDGSLFVWLLSLNTGFRFRPT